jgi:triacylglycerol lipase
MSAAAIQTSPQPSLGCRMLAAANAAYYIDGNGNFSPPSNNAIYNAVGWKAVPTALVGASGPDETDLNACLVGTSGDGVVVSFRGTLPITSPLTFEELMDWLQDFLASPYQDATVKTWGANVMVHPGFWEAVLSIATSLDAQLQQLAPIAGSFYFVGHSKGGAMATLAAMRYAILNPNSALPAVYTFASPRPANSAFLTAFNNANLAQNRYENYIDLAPLVPPSASDVAPLVDTLWAAWELGKLDQIWYNVLSSLLNNVVKPWDYTSMGTGYFIDQTGTLGGPDSTDSAAQWGSVVGTATGGDYESIAQAHCAACPSSACGGGYMTGMGGVAAGLCS